MNKSAKKRSFRLKKTSRSSEICTRSRSRTTKTAELIQSVLSAPSTMTINKSSRLNKTNKSSADDIGVYNGNQNRSTKMAQVTEKRHLRGKQSTESHIHMIAESKKDKSRDKAEANEEKINQNSSSTIINTNLEIYQPKVLLTRLRKSLYPKQYCFDTISSNGQSTQRDESGKFIQNEGPTTSGPSKLDVSRPKRVALKRNVCRPFKKANTTIKSSEKQQQQQQQKSSIRIIDKSLKQLPNGDATTSTENENREQSRIVIDNQNGLKMIIQFDPEAQSAVATCKENKSTRKSIKAVVMCGRTTTTVTIDDDSDKK